jgi:cob(I)alamin adenosyltransferase
MSIATKTGDNGTTGLMYGHRVPKTHPRVEACGTVDELNAALGLARATATETFVRDNLFWIQKSLVDVMGEIGVLPEDLPRYAKAGYLLVTPEMTAKLDALVKEIEAQNVSFKDWATPGGSVNSAALDVARTARVLVDRIRGIAERGDCGLPQPPVGFALALCALGGDAERGPLKKTDFAGG